MNHNARSRFPSPPDTTGPFVGAGPATAMPNIFGGLASAQHTSLSELVVAAAAGLADRGELAVSAEVSAVAAGQDEYEPPVDLADYAARRQRAANGVAPTRRVGSRARCR
jgi:hypothetical protein